MRVLFVNAYRQRGGATIAARRIADAVKAHVEVEWLVLEDLVREVDTTSRFHGALGAKALLAWEQFRSQGTLRPEALFSTGFLDDWALRRVNEIDPDVIHLHWPHAGMLGNRFLTKCDRPVVWTLHDQHLLTGGCHYTGGCNQWQTTGCTTCPMLSPRNQHLANDGFEARPEIDAIVSPSLWLAEQAVQRGFMPRGGIHTIPNPVPLDVFRPLSRDDCRGAIGADDDELTLVAGAVGWDQDKRKGKALLRAALERLNKPGVTLHTFGGDTGTTHWGHVKVIGHGRVSEDKLVQLYNAADAFMLPSLEENYANTANEATACGAPLIASAVGGNPDFFEQGAKGALVPVDGIDAWLEAIQAVEQRRVPACDEGRTEAVRGMAGVAKKYLEVYERISVGT